IVIVITLLAACAAGSRVTPAPVASPEVVRVDSGFVRGTRTRDAFAWRGIPYAAPPIDALRWRPPQPVTPWTGIREATGFGYACMQSGSSQAPDDSVTGSEDCLTLNVWRPSNATRALPVMVFVHGGYFTWGSSSYRKQGVDLYDGDQLATRGDVV